MGAEFETVVRYLPFLAAFTGLAGFVFGLVGLVRATSAQRRSVNAEIRANNMHFVSQRRELLELVIGALEALHGLKVKRLDTASSFVKQKNSVEARLARLEIQLSEHGLQSPLNDQIIAKSREILGNVEGEIESTEEEINVEDPLMDQLDKFAASIPSAEISSEYSVSAIELSLRAREHATRGHTSLMRSISSVRMGLSSVELGIDELAQQLDETKANVP